MATSRTRAAWRPECATDMPPIKGDATQLRQVIHNLVQNGLDAVSGRSDGHVGLRTEVARFDDGRPRVVRLKVTDNGPGFAEKVLKRAFEPYVTTKSKGTGLGLAVVKKIADEHGARVRIVNLPPGARTALTRREAPRFRYHFRASLNRALQAWPPATLPRAHAEQRYCGHPWQRYL